MNSRQRFQATMRFGRPDRVPCLEDGIRDGVVDVWRTQGLPADADLCRIFPHDRHELMELDLDPRPEPVTWPNSPADLDDFRRLLDANDPARFPDDWAQRVSSWHRREHVLMLRVHHGLFLSLGVDGWGRFNEVIRLLVRKPGFVRQTMRLQGEFAARLAERFLQQVEIDAALFVEPICDSNRPLVSPEMHEDFVLRSYEPLLQVLHRYGVETVIFMSFGNPRTLLPGIMKWGFNCLWACEVNAEAMAYSDIHREYGRDLRLVGGIDLDSLRQGREAIEREVLGKALPLLQDGGYIPLADGRIREDVPYENYVYYRRLLEKITSCQEIAGKTV